MSHDSFAKTHAFDKNGVDINIKHASMFRVCPRKPLFLLCASMIAVSRILKICPETTFSFTKTSMTASPKVSQFVMGTYTYLVPKEEGARPYGWVAYQDFNNTIRNILFASDFIPLF